MTNLHEQASPEFVHALLERCYKLSSAESEGQSLFQEFLNRKNSSGKTALGIALDNKKYEIMSIILSYRPKISLSEFKAALDKTDESMCYAFINAGADREFFEIMGTNKQLKFLPNSNTNDICTLARQHGKTGIYNDLVKICQTGMTFPMIYAERLDKDNFEAYWKGHSTVLGRGILDNRIIRAIKGKLFLANQLDKSHESLPHLIGFDELFCLDHTGKSVLGYAVWAGIPLFSHQLKTNADQMHIDALKEKKRDLCYLISICAQFLGEDYFSDDYVKNLEKNPFYVAAFNGLAEACDIFIKLSKKSSKRKQMLKVALFGACLAGEAAIAQTLISEEPTLRDSELCGYTPLMYAVGLGLDPDTGEEKDQKASKEVSVLDAKYESLFKYLIAVKVDLDKAVGSPERTALIRAVKYRKKRLCTFLLEKGANPLVTVGKNKFTPLMFAAHYGHPDMCTALLRNYYVSSTGNIYAQTSAGATALCFALEGGWDDVAVVLLKEALGYREDTGKFYDPDKGKILVVAKLENLGTTVLHEACKKGMLGTASLILEYYQEKDKEKRSSSDKSNRSSVPLSRGEITPLMVLAMSGNAAGITRLGVFPAIRTTVGQTDVYGLTALMHAARLGHVDASLDLRVLGADQNFQRKSDGMTASMLLAGYTKLPTEDAYKKFFQRVQGYGPVALERKNNNGRTALMCGAEKGNELFCKALVALKANISTEDNDYKEAYQLALEKGHIAVAEFLLDNHPSLLTLPVSERMQEKEKMLSKAGVPTTREVEDVSTDKDSDAANELSQSLTEVESDLRDESDGMVDEDSSVVCGVKNRSRDDLTFASPISDSPVAGEENLLGSYYYTSTDINRLLACSFPTILNEDQRSAYRRYSLDDQEVVEQIGIIETQNCVHKFGSVCILPPVVAGSIDEGPEDALVKVMENFLDRRPQDVTEFCIPYNPSSKFYYDTAN